MPFASLRSSTTSYYFHPFHLRIKGEPEALALQIMADSVLGNDALVVNVNIKTAASLQWLLDNMW